MECIDVTRLLAPKTTAHASTHHASAVHHVAHHATGLARVAVHKVAPVLSQCGEAAGPLKLFRAAQAAAKIAAVAATLAATGPAGFPAIPYDQPPAPPATGQAAGSDLGELDQGGLVNAGLGQGASASGFVGFGERGPMTGNQPVGPFASATPVISPTGSPIGSPPDPPSRVGVPNVFPNLLLPLDDPTTQLPGPTRDPGPTVASPTVASPTADLPTTPAKTATPAPAGTVILAGLVLLGALRLRQRVARRR